MRTDRLSGKTETTASTRPRRAELSFARVPDEDGR